ncbi:MAG: CusA/CzcA family heavy metal efflux RND transporter [Flavobacteriales bacterium]
MDKIIEFSVKNKLIIFLFVIGLIGWGSYSIKQLPIDALPDITNNQVQIITLAPTLAAQEVEQYISYPIEIAIASVPNLIEQRSISRFGLSVVTVVFKEDMDIYLARQIITEKLKEAEEAIPTGVGTPELAPVSTGLGEIYQYTLKPQKGFESKYDDTDLRTIQDWIVKRQLLGIPGVAEVSTLGGHLKQYEVAIKPNKLKSLDITIQEVFEALQQNNENTGGSYIDKKPNAYFIRGIGLLSSLEDIEQIVIKTINGIPVLIRDVAQAQYGSATRYGAITADGKGESVGGMVLMLKGENSATVTEAVKKRMASIQESLPKGIVIEPFIDREKLVTNAISTVKTNLLEGALIVIFVLVLLLGNWRAGLIVASVIPLALLFAISMMNFFGVSGNLMSLGAIDFGLVVDGAVIIVESIIHRITLGNKFKNHPKLTAQEMDVEVIDSSKKIRKSAAFGEIIILIVYLPILTLVGIEGKMFKPMAMTVAFAILGAFILSLTYVPMMSALCLSRKTTHKKNISDRLIGFLEKLYQPLLKSALKIKGIIILFSLIIFGFALYTFSNMGGEFIPTLDEGDLAVNMRIKPGSSLSQTIETTTKLEKILMGFPEVEKVVSKIGAGEIPTDPMPMESGDMIIVLKPKDQWTTASTRDNLVDKMKEAMSVIPGVGFEFSQPVQLRFNELMTGVRSDVAIKIYGDDLDVLAEKANQVSSLINQVEGVGDIKVEQVQGLPQITVRYNKAKLSQYGLKVNDLNMVLRTAFAGSKAGIVFEGEKRFDLVVRLGKEDRSTIENIKNLYINTDNGQQIPIEQVADIQYEFSAMQISRDSGKRRITIGLNIRNRDVESVINDIDEILSKKLNLPTGYTILYGGQFENLQSAKDRLLIAVPVALLLILTLLYFTFHSLKQSLLIFTAIPLSAIGGVFALWIRDMPFSISAGIGFIALFGVAVLNGIVLIGYFNQLEKEGMTDIYQRVIEGTKVRLRPVILTASVASLGFLPMAISTSSGAEVQKPLATVVIGGLISATFLTLIVLPCLYIMFSNTKKIKFNKKNFVALFLFGITASLNAQQITSSQEAVDYAVGHNLEIKSTEKMKSQQELKSKQNFRLGNTVFGVEYGKYNSASERDLAFSVSQSFPFPTVFAKNKALNKAQLEGSKLWIDATKRTLEKDIKHLWQKGIYLQSRKELLIHQDSLIQELARGTNVQYETGDVNYLTKVNAESYSADYKKQLKQLDKEIETIEYQLRFYIGSQQIIWEKDSLKPLSFKEKLSIENHPLLKYYKNQTLVNEKKIEVEKTKLLPEFTLGYNNQSLIENPVYDLGDRFSYYSLGISVPIFNKNKTDVKIAQIEAEKSRLDSQYTTNKFQNNYLILQNELEKQQISLNYFENTALKQSKEIQHFALRNYQEGEINQIEYLQYLNRALEIDFNYLDEIYKYNELVIELENLTKE